MTWRAYLALAIIVASFGAGYYVRDLRSDRDTAQRDAGDAKAEVEVVKDARKEDKQTQAGVAEVETENAQQQEQTRVEYKYITREVIRYVAANPSPAGCGLTADGLRIWRAANAGTASAEPGRAGGFGDAVPGGTDGRSAAGQARATATGAH